MDRKAHWEGVYTAKGEREVSWFQEEPALSLELIRAVCPARGRVIDGGGGASVLVDRLLDSGFEHVAVLDISRSPFDKARARLGDRANDVRWIPHATGLFLTWMKVKMNDDGQAAANLPTVGGTK